MSFFDEVTEANSSQNRNQKPIWTLDLDNASKSSDVLKWLNGEIEYLEEENRARLDLIQRHLALYKGIQYWSQGGGKKEKVQEADSSLTEKSRSFQKFVLNHLFELTSQRISRLTEYKPQVALVPPSDDWGDKIATKSAEKFVQHLWYVTQFEMEIIPTMAQWSRVMGEAYSFVLWNADAGEEHPDWVKAQTFGKKVPLLNENGEEQQDDKGQTRYLDQPVNLGEVSVEYDDPFNVLLERNYKYIFNQVDFCFRRKIMTLDAAEFLYPEAKGKLKIQKSVKAYDFEKMETVNLANMVVVWTMYLRPTIFNRKGREIVFTREALCKSREHQYKHKRLPCTRLCDIKHPKDLHGHSFFENIKGGTGAYNNLTNMFMRNAVLVSHPKWMLPSGSAKLEQLGNDITIVQFRGPIKPDLVTAPCISADLFNFRREIKQDFQQISQVQGVSRGEPPPGVDAAIALQFLEEQEEKAAGPDIMEMNGWVINTTQLMLSVAGQKYEPSDERTIRIQGRNGAWMSKRLKVDCLEKGYEVRVQGGNSLPKGRTARMQALVFLQKNYPDMLPREQVLEMMDLAQNDKFITAATTAVRAAEEENDQMMEGLQIPEPEEYENHIQHWLIHYRQTQEYAFKHEMPEEVRTAFRDHIIATEMLMAEKALKNAVFAQKLLALENYPLFYEPDVPSANTAAGMSPAPVDELLPAATPDAAEPVNPALSAEPPEKATGEGEMGGIPQPPAVAQP